MNTYLILTLSGDYFAISVDNVLEVMQKQNITVVPKAQRHLLGVVNFRGDILPVVDTGLKFEMAKLDVNAKYIVIILELEFNNEKVRIAATADSVVDVIVIDDSEIIAVPELGLNFKSQFTQGAFRRNEDTIILLSVENVFSIFESTSVLK